MLSPAARPLPLRPAAAAYHFFNRYCGLLELRVTHSTQTTAPSSNRYYLSSSMRGLVSATAYNPPMPSDPPERASREKTVAALASVGSAVLLVSLKIFIAVRTG